MGLIQQVPGGQLLHPYQLLNAELEDPLERLQLRLGLRVLHQVRDLVPVRQCGVAAELGTIRQRFTAMAALEGSIKGKFDIETGVYGIPSGVSIVHFDHQPPHPMGPHLWAESPAPQIL